MDKKVRNLLILVGVLALLCIGYAVAGVVFPDEEEETTEDSSTDEVAVFRMSEDGLTRLAFTYDKDGDGEAELWEFRRSDDGTVWTWTGDESVPLGASLFSSYAETLAAATSVKVISSVTEDQLEEYGLTAPVKRVTFTDAAGGEQSFCLGAYNAYNSTYCAYINGDTTTVYLLDSTLFEAFEEPIESFVSYDDLPECEEDALISVTLTQGDRAVTCVRTPVEVEVAVDTTADTEAETSADTEADTTATATEYVWMRSVNGDEPVRVADDLADSIDILLGNMDYLACYGVTAHDFPTYGLDADTTIMTVVYETTVDGETVEATFTLTLGGTNSYDYYYANPEGTTLTMLLGGSVWYKLMTYDDEHLMAGDETEATDAES